MTKDNFSDYKLSDEIRSALKDLGYEKPTEIQSKVIPHVFEGKDLMARAQTGSGKTAAFGIPICEQVDWLENKPQALILTPTRELAVQVKDDLTNIGRFKRVKAVAIFGKQPITAQMTELKQKNHVVVGTPGRVLDHIERGTLPLEMIRYFVIDEADEMLNMGFIEQVESIIKRLPKEKVTLFFSATLPEAVKNLAQQYLKNPVDIEIEAAGLTTEKIEHVLYHVREQEKFALLKNITVLENPDSCIIFCATRDRVDELCDELRADGYGSEKIHGDMNQKDRLSVMNDFKKGAFRYLIATDVAARGIDIESITHVINFDIPLEKESYVHRTGRTARAGMSGKAITFATPREDRFVKEIEEYIGFEIRLGQAPSASDVAIHQAAFEEKMSQRPSVKKSKSEQLNKQIMKLYFNGGKRKKLRAVDFVGTIAKIEGISAEDIGIITIQDRESFVEILNGKGPHVLNIMRQTKVKGKSLKVHEAK